MTFSEMQAGILRNAELYSEQYGVKIDECFAVLKLYEEVGEFAQAVLIHRQKSKPQKCTTAEESLEMLARELADIVGLAIINANRFGVDLEKAIQEKWLSKV